MFQILGSIIVKETGEGIPNLVVALFDADKPQFQLHDLWGGGPEGAGVDRIGSVLTDTNGRFELGYEREDFRLHDQEERPDLMLVVFAPEDSRSAEDPSPLMPQERILHISRVPRQDAGRTEAYAIRLLQAQLERFDISVGDRSAPTPERYVDAIRRTWAFRDAVKEQLRPRLKQEAEKAQAIAKEAKKKFENLSAVPIAARQSPLFVANREQLAAAQNTAIEKGLERLAQYSGVLRLRLTQSDIERLNAASGEGEEHTLHVVDGHVEGEASASAVLALVSERTGGTELIRTHSLLDACVPPERGLSAATEEGVSSPTAIIPVSRTVISAGLGEAVRVDVRVEDMRGLPVAGIDVDFNVTEGEGFVSPATATSDADGRASATWILGTTVGAQTLTASAAELPAVTFRATAAEAVGPLTPEDAEGRLLARVIGQVQSLESVDGTDALPRRPDQQKVQEAIQSLKLEGGPADATAYHDFHVLQIAFKHVWTEAFDKVLKGKAELLYKEIVKIVSDWGTGEAEAFADEDIAEIERLVTVAEQQIESLPALPAVPRSVTMFFPDINDELWNEMTLDEQEVIIAAATNRGTVEYKGETHKFAKGSTDEPGRRRVGLLVIAAAQKRLLEKGSEEKADRTPESAASSRFPRLKRLLKDIQDRLHEKYAFDIFAADSYNFGILLTYRQEWEPLSYQASDLVTTIPLAPGETRKYTKKEIIKKSRAEKEIEKALSSRAEEATQTTRAEAEIMRKTSTATNFIEHGINNYRARHKQLIFLHCAVASKSHTNIRYLCRAL